MIPGQAEQPAMRESPRPDATENQQEKPMQTLIWDGERAPLAKALVAAQKATEAVKKANENPAFKSKYADLAAVVEAVVPALNTAGVAVVQSPSFNGEWINVETMLLHETGASLTSNLAMRPSKMDPQGLGSAITYARRYALLAMTGAAPEDDDGNAASGPQAKAAPAASQGVVTKAPTLADRADRLDATMKAVESKEALEKAWSLAETLRKDLDAKDPERLAALQFTYEVRRDEMSQKVAA